MKMRNSDLSKQIDERMADLAKIIVIPSGKKDQVILIQKIFVLVSEIYNCSPETIIMNKNKISLRSSSSARHYLIYLFHKKISWNTHKTSKLFCVSEDTVSTSIIKFHLKSQDVNSESNKIKEATETLLLNLNKQPN